ALRSERERDAIAHSRRAQRRKRLRAKKMLCFESKLHPAPGVAVMPTKNSNAQSAGEEHIYLLNRVSLDDYLSFMASYPVDAQTHDRALPATEWKSARDRMDQLRRTEPTWADNAAIQPLPPAMQELVEKVQADPIFRRAFGEVPV